MTAETFITDEKVDNPSIAERFPEESERFADAIREFEECTGRRVVAFGLNPEVEETYDELVEEYGSEQDLVNSAIRGLIEKKNEEALKQRDQFLTEQFYKLMHRDRD